MSDPVAWGVGVMLACMGLAELISAGLPWWRSWLDRGEKTRIGFKG